MSNANKPDQRAAEEDGLAVFAELYPALRRFAAVVADLDVDPDDLVQEALAATLGRHQLSEIRQPLAYLRKAIINAGANHRRKAVRFRRLVPLLAVDLGRDDHYPSDLQILDMLSPIDRAVVFLADVELLPHAVIADELGLTAAAVRKRASRGRRQLRQALRPDIAPVSEDRS